MHLRFDGAFDQVRRYRHIMAVLIKYGFEEIVTGVSGRLKTQFGSRAVPLRVRQHEDKRNRAERVRLALEELGPTFIKLGQLLSTRPDLIPPDYIKQLEKLQDQVSPERGEVILRELEAELGSVDQVFKEFDTEPIAAGSIAHVHRAVLKDGSDAVVKIRRPGIVKTIRTEVKILENLASLYKSTLSEEDTIDPLRMVQEFGRAVNKEVDLANERRNLLRFGRNFADDETVHIPCVYEDYCTESVLTMEYIHGVRPGDFEKIDQMQLDRKVIAKRGADFVLKQIFTHGFFHTDPHPGNFFLLEENVLAPIDFGQVALLTSSDRKLLTEMVMAIVDTDGNRMVQALERSALITEDANHDAMVRDAEDMLESYAHLPLKEIPFSEAVGRSFDIMRKHKVRPPSQFTLMLKSLMTIETFAVSLDPEFDILEALKPYAVRFGMRYTDPKYVFKHARKIMRDANEMAHKLPEDINAIIRKFRSGQFQVRVHHEHLENLSRTLDKSSNRVSFALIIAALLIASSIVISQDTMALGIIHLQTLGFFGYIAAAIMGIWLLISIIRSKHL